MKKINVLDCTLRDGGYVNNWKFGEEDAVNIVKKLSESNLDIIEVGFIRNETYNRDRTVFTCKDDFKNILSNKKHNVKYAALIEMANYFPIEKLWNRGDDTVDAIRYSFWKRKLDEGWEYAKQIKEKGYDLFVQPTRVEQYSDVEFENMIKKFNELQPTALYIVDTFGLLTHKQVIHYAQIADRVLGKDIALGYHAHNNKQQALLNAVSFLELELDREVCVDSSVFGMGRGPGNLCTEIITEYINNNFSGNYILPKYYDVFDNHISKIYNEKKWGYSLEYFLSAGYGANPSLAEYYHDAGLSMYELDRLFSNIPYEDRIRFSKETSEELYNKYKDK